MRLLRLPLLTLLLLPSLLGGATPLRAQTPSPTAPGSLPPPRPIQPAAPASAPAASPPAAAPAARPPATPPRPPSTAPAQPPRPPAATPPRPPAATPPRPANATPPRPATQQPPTVGRTPPAANRRPAATAAGAAAGAAAAGAAAATARPPEPAQPPAPPPIPPTGQVTGLALPRFAALRSDEVNMRVGPNTTFPIEWTFQRRDLPVMIVGEFQLWRRIRDPDGAEGWVHSSTLAGRRTVLVRPAAAAPDATLRRRPEENGVTVAKLRTGVIARVRECEAGSAWCELQVGGHRGFLRRADLWGIGAEEEIK